MNPNGLRTHLADFVRELQAVDELKLAHDFFGGCPNGRRMIDVGAHHGESFGPFAKDGWEVFAFEPDPRNRDEIAIRWGAAPNVVIDPRAVADVDKSEVSLLISTNTYISSLSSFDSSHADAVTVGQITLRTYCKEKGITAVDFLKIDAEGHDFRVLQGFPWPSIRPRFVICEFEDRKTRRHGYGFREMADLLLSHGYHVVVSEWYPIVSYHGPFRWKRFFVYPGQTPPEDGNGNLLAVSHPSDYRRLQWLCRRKSIVHALSSAFRAAYGRLR